MNRDINYLIELLTQKECSVTNEADREKVSVLKDLFRNPHCFFDVEMEAAVGILDFLGIPEEEIEETYMGLISPKQFQKMPVAWTSLDAE